MGDLLGPECLRSGKNFQDRSCETEKGVVLDHGPSCLTPALSCTADEVQGHCMARSSPKASPASKQPESRVSFSAWLDGLTLRRCDAILIP